MCPASDHGSLKNEGEMINHGMTGESDSCMKGNPVFTSLPNLRKAARSLINAAQIYSTRPAGGTDRVTFARTVNKGVLTAARHSSVWGSNETSFQLPEG